MYTALNASLFYLPLNLVQVQGYSEQAAGFAILPFAILISAMSRYSGIFADKFGARKPLIVGPLVSSAGLFLLMLPGLTSGPSQYWTTFFPGIFILGMGMGIVVAPLTAAVMAAVPTHNTGIASGINNTMSRIAGLIAIAILGMVIILSFKSNLETQTVNLNISQKAKSELIKNSDKLGETKPPQEINQKFKEKISSEIKFSFINAFNLIILISVILAFLGSVTSYFSVEKGILKS